MKYTLNLTPTWKSLAFDVATSAAKQFRQLERGTIKEKDAWAVSELYRMAEAADLYNSTIGKEKPEAK